MVKELQYKSTIKLMSFLFLETKKAASLVLQGHTPQEIKEMSMNDNIFQVKTEARKRDIASKTLERINALDDYLKQKLVNGDVEDGKQLIIYAIMKTDRLLFEFMNEVYRDKHILRETYISDADFNVFFHRKREQSEKVASWNDYTYYKIKQVIIRVLFEAGFIKNQKENRELKKPIIKEDIARHIRDIGDEIYLKAMLGEA